MEQNQIECFLLYSTVSKEKLDEIAHNCLRRTCDKKLSAKCHLYLKIDHCLSVFALDMLFSEEVTGFFLSINLN